MESSTSGASFWFSSRRGLSFEPRAAGAEVVSVAGGGVCSWWSALEIEVMKLAVIGEDAESVSCLAWTLRSFCTFRLRHCFVGRGPYDHQAGSGEGHWAVTRISDFLGSRS